MKTDVIIPCLNEEKTIAEIVYQLTRYPLIGNVHVMVDDNTNDHTQFIAENAGAHAHRLVGITGKGQLVAWGKVFIETERVILCDGDYTGMNHHAISLVVARNSPAKAMRIVAPAMPTKTNWSKEGLPIPFNPSAWCMNSGFRSLPVSLLKEIEQPHGYLLETQLNKAARALGYPIEMIVEPSLHTPLRFTKERMEKMEADRLWGLANGVFDNA